MANNNNNNNSANASDSYNSGQYTLSFHWDADTGDLSVHKQWNISQATNAITLDWGETIALYSFIDRHMTEAEHEADPTDDIDLETET